jgi:uncharacterized protein
MNPFERRFEFRCPVHGFVELNSWERDLVNHSVYQRLRRVRQLAWTEYVYPGAVHTRFEHCLGVLHVASKLFDSVVANSADLLRGELHLTPEGIARARQLVRLAALLHDVGHAPFSHGPEDLMPNKPGGGGRFKHEDYSAAMIRESLKDGIENDSFNKANYHITASEVASLIEGTPDAGVSLVWREIVSGQMDADRMDYLLRDSLHIGVQYGRFDLHRLINTAVLLPDPDGGSHKIGVTEGGAHTAEALVLARYFMFTQVYFHKTRIAYDLHLKEALLAILPSKKFPIPSQLNEYLDWDDWRVLGEIVTRARTSGTKGAKACRRLVERNHYREIYHTPEIPGPKDLERLGRVKDAVGNLVMAEESADRSWYKKGPADILIEKDTEKRVEPLSSYSKVIKRIQSYKQVRLYVDRSKVAEAEGLRDGALGDS